MTRFICLDPFPQQQATSLSKQGSHVVITPSGLAARAILAQHQPLHTLALKHLQQQGWAKASRLQSQRLFRQTLQDVLQPADLLGTTRAWMPAMRSLLKSGTCLKHALETDVTNLSARTVKLIAVTQQYQSTLHKNSLVDTGELYWQAAKLSTELTPDPQRLLVYGYFQLQRDELAWLNQIAASGTQICLPTCESPFFADTRVEIAWLQQQGWQIMPASNISVLLPNAALCDNFLSAKPPEQPIETASAHVYGTFEAEIRGTLAQVKALLNADIPAKEIAIIARDERAYGPKLIEIAWEYGVPIRALYSTPLLTTRLGTWIQLLLEVLDTGFPFEATAKLLSHPLCSNPDSGFWATARAQHPKGFQQWKEIASDHLGINLSALAQVNQTRRRDTWIDWWERLFRTFDLRRRCARWARESLAFNKLQKGLVELSKPEAETLSWSALRPQLEDLLESLSVPAQPGRGGVELHSPASVVGAQYAHLFVMGMADGVLPPPVSNDRVLDFFERQQLRDQSIALPTASELFRTEALWFYYLLQAAATGRITFSYPKLHERTERLPSPYLKRLSLPAIASPEQPIASREELRRYYLRHPHKEDDAILAQAVRAFGIEQYRESTQPANEYDGVINIPFDYSNWVFSASQITRLGQCRFKWFADKVLKLGAVIEVEEDLSPSLRGNLYHKVVELLIEAVQANSAHSLTDEKLLREKFLEAEQAVHLPTLLNWEVRREEHLRQLAITLQKPEFWPPEATPIALEKHFKGEWHGLKVTGRIDRIDETPSGLVLIDYKTGTSVPKGIQDTNGKVTIDLQLPLYREMAADLYPEKSVADTRYFSLTKGKKLSVSSKAPQHELPAMIETCKRDLDEGNYPVQPDTKRDACTYCDFDLLCRQGSRLARKEK
ncbi:MAG: PD-(D/E)XK nuclease superfamily [Phormidesmis priestleyi Ana]|uniref:PD-(D/E)XK nuclease superfamily n=1 Tax=Phormidesmis priestleyi Ana TaxID=1666911 RepID=A0A0P7YNV7_9CYAN|nr:MAG: PD-(D/E)XK nuclease superfamily [Phormidesmis priestleyi Ana]